MAWRAVKDSKGRTYYYDTVTRVTSWTLPKGADLVPSNTTTTQESNKNTANNSDGKTDQVENIETLSESQAKERFISMLKDHGVDIQWSFERVMDELSCDDKRYWFGNGSSNNINSQWDDPLWKQSIWKDYVWDQQSQRLEDHIASFKSLLKQKYNDGMLKLWHPWPFARKHILNMDTDYSFVILDDNLQKKIYYKFINKLRKLNEFERNKSVNQAKDEMRLYLETIMYPNGVDSDTISKPISWDHLVSKYLSNDNKRFVANKNFQLLTMEDILLIYMDLLKRYEEKLTQKLNELEELNYTRDRFARDQFKSLLNGECYTSGSLHGIDGQDTGFVMVKIRFNSDWNNDIYPRIKNDPRFLNLVGRNGSSPLDLFHDKVNQLRTILRTKSSLVEDILIEKNIDIKQINAKQLKKILLEERQRLKLNDKDSSSNDGDDDDIDELIEFIGWQRHSKDLQTFERILVELLNNVGTRGVIPSWETVWPDLQKMYKDQFSSLTEDEMHKSYSILIQQMKQQQQQQRHYQYKENPNLSRKRTLEQVELDY